MDEIRLDATKKYASPALLSVKINLESKININIMTKLVPKNKWVISAVHTRFLLEKYLFTLSDRMDEGIPQRRVIGIVYILTKAINAGTSRIVLPSRSIKTNPIIGADSKTVKINANVFLLIISSLLSFFP